jgi:hypothetical protein
MSVQKYYIVWCDRGTHGLGQHGYKAREAKTVNGAREDAIKNAGYRFQGYPGRDLCPIHQREEN